MKRYFNEERKYKEPTLIEFKEPITIKLSELGNFLESYRPFPCADVYIYERLEYGDFGNYVNAIIESRLVDPKYCKRKSEVNPTIPEGFTSFSITDRFWHYDKERAFWKESPQVGYSTDYNNRTIKQYIDEVETEIQGVFIISWTDKNRIESIRG